MPLPHKNNPQNQRKSPPNQKGSCGQERRYPTSPLRTAAPKLMHSPSCVSDPLGTAGKGVRWWRCLTTAQGILFVRALQAFWWGRPQKKIKPGNNKLPTQLWNKKMVLCQWSEKVESWARTQEQTQWCTGLEVVQSEKHRLHLCLASQPCSGAAGRQHYLSAPLKKKKKDTEYVLLGVFFPL